MNLTIKSPDPFNILVSTKKILEFSKFVTLSEKNIKDICPAIEQSLKQSYDALSEGFNILGSFEDNLQLTFIEDTINFCFWSNLNTPRWQVEYPDGEITEGGWFGLQKCFERALSEEMPILDARYLAKISVADTANIFRSANEHAIPLLEERCACLREAGLVLLDKYNGKFTNILESSGYDAVRLVRLIVKDFPSFEDVAEFENMRVPFLKRAQIVANDIAYVLSKNKRFRLKNLNQLTAFADYKIPQILRHFGIITYARELTEKVDSGTQLPQGSREEVEIRSATIWGVELLCQELKGTYSAATIDNALWFLSQNQEGMTPYHRTRTIYY